MLLSKDRNIPNNDKCIICKNYITIEDIRKKDYEVVITKRSKNRKYVHTSCIKRRFKNEM